jgi:hypothetical protein
LTPERLNVWGVQAAALADVIVFGTSPDDGRTMRWWRTDSNGGGLAEIPTIGAGNIAALSPDGVHMYFRKVDPVTERQRPEIWRRPIAGGAEEQVGDAEKAGPPMFSPDGRRFARFLFGPSTPAAPVQVEIAHATDGRIERTLTMPGGSSSPRWAPSSDALLFVRTLDGVQNIWRLPIDGAPATQITRFGPDTWASFGWTYTADGTQLLFFRQERTPGEMLQFRKFR